MSSTIDKNQSYNISDALGLVKANSKSKFDATVEVHVNLGTDVKKADQLIRTTTTLPHGTGKTKKVAVFASKKIKDADLELTEATLSKIESGELKPGNDFDVIVCEPSLMSKLAKVARILGPQGMMPNPKSGTVTEDVEKAVEQIKKGKIEIKNEQNAPIVHSIIGKVSFDNKSLEENFNEFLGTLKQARPQKVKPDVFIKSCFVSASMGPSVRVNV